MSGLRPSHRQAAQHFDERFTRKQSESFLSQHLGLYYFERVERLFQPKQYFLSDCLFPF